VSWDRGASCETLDCHQLPGHPGPHDPPQLGGHWITPDVAADLGVHAMDPDRRHTLCGFDVMGQRKLPPPPLDFDPRPIECPLCRAVLAAVG
jgi:hypothetical protein